MKQRFLAVYILLLAAYGAFAQNTGIGTLTPDASAAPDISNSGKRLLIPRMSTASINPITNPAKGSLVYDSVANRLMVNIGTPAAPLWQAVAASAAWGLGGNTAINPSTQFIGSTDNQPLRFRVINIPAGELNPLSGNVFLGLREGQSNTTGLP
jgi:trimeric autotransporter adhesin